MSDIRALPEFGFRIDDCRGRRLHSRVVAVLRKRTGGAGENGARMIGKVGHEISKSPKLAHEFLRKHGLLAKDNKLARKCR